MEKSIGAFWIRVGNKGEYWIGNIELPDGTKENVIVFKNSYKKDKQPDLMMYKQQPKQEKQENITTQNEEVMDSSDLPF